MSFNVPRKRQTLRVRIPIALEFNSRLAMTWIVLILQGFIHACLPVTLVYVTYLTPVDIFARAKIMLAKEGMWCRN